MTYRSVPFAAAYTPREQLAILDELADVRHLITKLASGAAGPEEWDDVLLELHGRVNRVALVYVLRRMPGHSTAAACLRCNERPCRCR